MGDLRINRVLYEGDNYYFKSPHFVENLILIEGKNGNGKSTFCKLVYHGLGGVVDQFKKTSREQHQEIVGDRNNYIELDISINEQGYLVRRLINDNEITVTPYSIEPVKSADAVKAVGFEVVLNTGDTKVLPINRSENKPITFSDWILERLEIAVIELSYGSATFKIKINDLMRLMYHDQSTDPNYIYKKPESDNYISDSILIRKVIFELLLGQKYSAYYQAISKTKALEKSKSSAKLILDEYESIARELRGSDEPKNSTFLRKEMEDNDDRLERLHMTRESLKRPKKVDDNFSDIEVIKQGIIEKELTLSDKKRFLFDLYKERAKLLELKSITKLEVDQVAKIIHTHSQLNLFSPDTCPYCLSKVDRPKDHCVCGAKVDESEYERFFYTESEYKELLKTKQASFKSIDLALLDCRDDEARFEQEISDLESCLNALRAELASHVQNIGDETNTLAINDVDDKILELRELDSRLRQLIDIEIKLESLVKTLDGISDKVTQARRDEKLLELKAQQDISSKVIGFSEIYNEFMTESLPNCRSAKIDGEDYVPIINDFEYKEDSSQVQKRLMYFLTLLRMSIQSSDSFFPKFLMIDTPDTAGIDDERLIPAIGQISKILEEEKKCQIILTTGVGTYPDTFDKYVSIRLRDDDRLLKLKSDLVS